MSKTTTVMSTKGQIVLPRSIREAHRLRPGAQFIVEDRGDEIVLRQKDNQKKLKWSELAARVNYKGPRKSLRQMDEAITAEARFHK